MHQTLGDRLRNCVHADSDTWHHLSRSRKRRLSVGIKSLVFLLQKCANIIEDKSKYFVHTHLVTRGIIREKGGISWDLVRIGSGENLSNLRSYKNAPSSHSHTHSHVQERERKREKNLGGWDLVVWDLIWLLRFLRNRLRFNSVVEILKRKPRRYFGKI